MDGLAAAEYLAARGIPVVLVSGHPDSQHLVLEYEPLISLIVKPPTIEKVQTVIQLAIESTRNCRRPQ